MTAQVAAVEPESFTGKLLALESIGNPSTKSIGTGTPTPAPTPRPTPATTRQPSDWWWPGKGAFRTDKPTPAPTPPPTPWPTPAPSRLPTLKPTPFAMGKPTLPPYYCPAGFIRDRRNADGSNPVECIKCPAGRWSRIDDTMCWSCYPTHYVPNANQSACVPPPTMGPTSSPAPTHSPTRAPTPQPTRGPTPRPTPRKICNKTRRPSPPPVPRSVV